MAVQRGLLRLRGLAGLKVRRRVRWMVQVEGWVAVAAHRKAWLPCPPSCGDGEKGSEGQPRAV